MSLFSQRPFDNSMTSRSNNVTSTSDQDQGRCPMPKKGLVILDEFPCQVSERELVTLVSSLCLSTSTPLCACESVRVDRTCFILENATHCLHVLPSHIQRRYHVRLSPFASLPRNPIWVLKSYTKLVKDFQSRGVTGFFRCHMVPPQADPLLG